MKFIHSAARDCAIFIGLGNLLIRFSLRYKSLGNLSEYEDGFLAASERREASHTVVRRRKNLFSTTILQAVASYGFKIRGTVALFLS